MIKFELKINSDKHPASFVYSGSFVYGCKDNWEGIRCQLGKAAATMHQALRLACMGRDFEDEDTQKLMDLEPELHATMLKNALYAVEHYNEKGYPIPQPLVVVRKDDEKKEE